MCCSAAYMAGFWTTVYITNTSAQIFIHTTINILTEFIYQYRKNWKQHVDRIPKIILKYQPKGKRNLGRPLKRWKDSVL
jgi:tRNA(Arg) A34 adenosine deaminase TadA